MACAYEQIKHMIREDIIDGHIRQHLAPIMADQMQRLAGKHPCIKQYRQIGLFGCFDVMHPDGTIPQLQHLPVHASFVRYKQAYTENGLIGLLRFPMLHVAPPLKITKEELLDGFQRQDRALDTLDQALGF